MVDLSCVLTLGRFGGFVMALFGAARRFEADRLARPVLFGNVVGGLVGSLLILRVAAGTNLMNVRSIPLDPPWLLVPSLAGTVLAAAVIANDGSYLLMLAIAGIAIVCGTLGVDRRYEQRHPGGHLR